MPESPPRLPFPPPPENLPSPERFPHNERGASAFAVLDQDQHQAIDLLLFVPSTDRRGLIRLLAQRVDPTSDAPCRVRVLLERPLGAYRRWRSFRDGDVERAFREDWLKKGVSLADAPNIVKAQELLRTGQVEARLATQARPLRFTAQLTDGSLTLGGSVAGLDPGDQSLIALARFSMEKDEERLSEGRALLEALWSQGRPLDLGAVLDALLIVVSWEQALARAIGLILEGEWARAYFPASELSRMAKPLLAHQLAGLGQALYLLRHVGAALIADPTGAGKTDMGAWILRAASDRAVRTSGRTPRSPLLLTPKGVRRDWERTLASDTQLHWRVASIGQLQRSKGLSEGSPAQAEMSRWVGAAELLAVDEAHNFHNHRSNRSQALLRHTADQVVLLTATPINRAARDLLAMVDLIGADRLSDQALRQLDGLARSKEVLEHPDQRRRLQQVVSTFTVKRSRQEVVELLRQDPTCKFRYPDRVVEFYDIKCSDIEISILECILKLAENLYGVHLVGEKIAPPRGLGALRWDRAEAYLRTIPVRCKALARFEVLAAVRSSRAAIWEHIYGTDAARTQYGLSEAHSAKRDRTGDVIGRLLTLGGRPPRWGLSEALKLQELRWLWDAEAHRAASEADRVIYAKIAKEVTQLTAARERARAALLARLYAAGHAVLAFERRLITLDAIQTLLRADGVPSELYTGGVSGSGNRLKERFGLKSAAGARVGLLSDANSEGLSLQGADTVVHLDFPTVPRLAEQRSGRIDRFDTQHERITLFLPRDPTCLLPARGEALPRRLWEAGVVLGGSNLPDIAELYRPLDLDEAARRERQPEDDLGDMDAFRPLRELIGAGGLVGQEVYDAEKTERAPVTACISAVWGETPWALFALREDKDEAPCWIMKVSPTDPPVTDLREIAELLRARLGISTPSRPVGTPSAALITQHLQALEREEIALLPPLLRRALTLIEAHLKERENHRLGAADAERITDCLDVVQRLSFDGRVPELRRLGHACLRQLRPVAVRWREAQKRPARLFRLQDLEPHLRQEGMDLEALHRELAAVPLVAPLRERLLVAIIAIPAQYEAGPMSSPTRNGAEQHGN